MQCRGWEQGGTKWIHLRGRLGRDMAGCDEWPEHSQTLQTKRVCEQERERESVCVCVCVHKLWTAPVKRGHFIYLWLLCLRDGQGQAMCLLSCFCFVSWINLRNMSVNNSTDTHLSIPAVFHHGNPSPTAASLTLDREVFSTSSDIYTSVKKPLFICCTWKVPPTCFLVWVLVKYVLPPCGL